jgi:hypothetical protein
MTLSWATAAAVAWAAAPAQALVPSHNLPDGRQWEMVSPLQKNGASIEPIEEGVVQSALDGASVSYLAAREPVGEDPQGNTQRAQVLSSRGATGVWTSEDITTSHNASSGVITGLGWEYRMMSGDLASAIVEPQGDTPLAGQPEGSERTIYVRNAASCRSGSPGCYEPLVTSGNVVAGAHFGRTPFEGGIEFLDATPDPSTSVLRTAEALTPGTENTERGLLYAWHAGALAPVSVLPNGEIANLHFQSFLGAGDENMRNAVSADGRRFIWGAEPTTGHLYVTDLGAEHSRTVDAAQGIAEPEEGRARFQIADVTGSRVLFTDGERLTPNAQAAGNSAPDLYEAVVSESAGVLQSTLTDVTATIAPGVEAGVQGEVLASESSLGTIYIVATGVLTEARNVHGEAATQGQDNLYALNYDAGSHSWQPPVFVATLAEEDSTVWLATGNDLGKATSRVSPDGRYLAFVSHRSLTGYDNHDLNSGAADAEVYLYDSALDQLSCVSCNPRGTRPVGALDVGSPAYDRRHAMNEQWVAASLPGWTSMELGRAIYQSRYLDDSGRLFFNSIDALVPTDGNGTTDVYEFEPPGVGDCSAASAGPSRGCVRLISGATGTEESTFLDASESGDDVFFLTSEALAAGDSDTSYDVYDAHVCSTAAPCAQPVAEAPACEAPETCRSSLGTGDSEPFSAPASAVALPSGNLPPPKPSAKKTASAPHRKICTRVRGGHRRRVKCPAKHRKSHGSRSDPARHATAHRPSGRGQR